MPVTPDTAQERRQRLEELVEELRVGHEALSDAAEAMKKDAARAVTDSKQFRTWHVARCGPQVGDANPRTAMTFNPMALLVTAAVVIVFALTLDGQFGLADIALARVPDGRLVL